MSSFRFNRDPRRKQFMRLVTSIHELLEDAYWDEHKKSGLNKAILASRLGVNKSLVTRWFKGTSNITMETLSNLAYELDRDVEISFVERQSATKWVNIPSSNSCLHGQVIPTNTSGSNTAVTYLN